ncbi:transglycosylase SLT domain-containing protein [Kitasatospora purpeofusca]|uniref:transglycosylase SLT domain-containing protein n=1 Tax=Kitasatospora purpeofusca TaxID=67352 RepID=UPI0035D9689C
MALDIVGQAGVDIVPVLPGFHEKLKARILPIADRVGLEAGRVLGNRMGEAMRAGLAGAGEGIGRALGNEIAIGMARRIAEAIPDAVQEGGDRAEPAAARDGGKVGGAFARALKSRLQAAYKSMPKLDIDANTSQVDKDLNGVRARLKELSGKRIGIDIDAATASARIADLDAELRQLGSRHPNPVVRIDTATARAALAEIKAEIAAITAEPAEVSVRPTGAFREQLLAQVRAAQEALPSVSVDVDVAADAAEVQLAALRATLASIPERLTIDVDFTDADAVALITLIQAELAELRASSTVRLDIRASAAAAEAELATVAATVAALDRQRAVVRVDTSGALSAIIVLTLQLATMVTIPGLPALVAGIGAIGAAATSAAAGVGVLALAAAPAIMKIAGALQARKAAQEEANTAAASGAKADSQAEQRALSLAGAQQSLASARRSAAQQADSSARQTAQAEQALADATAKAADDRVAAEQNVTDAIAEAADAQRRSARDVADAVEKAADAQVQSARRVEQAGQSLADAQRSERQAQDDLTTARRTAAQQLEDYKTQLADGALDEREAALRVARAEQELQAVRTAGAQATALQRAEAQLAYDRALQQQREQRTRYAQLQADAKAAGAAGVDGADVVVTAQDRLAQAQQRTADQTRAVADAQAEAAKAAAESARKITDAQDASARTAARSAREIADAQESAAKVAVQSTRSIADAQTRVVDAQRSAAESARSAAESIISAQRGVRQAMLSTATSTGGAATAASRYEDTLRKLSPPARTLFDAIVGPDGLSTAFRTWSDSMAPTVLPLFVRGVNRAKTAIPGLTTLVENSSRAVGTLMDKASADLKSPFWTRFRTDIRESAEPAIVGLGVMTGNIMKGMAGAFDAFLPHIDGIMKRLSGERFANWGTKLHGSPEFEKFIAYVDEMGPKVAHALGSIGGALLDVGHALSPLSGPVLDGLRWFGETVSKLATDYPILIQVLWIGIAAFKVARLVAIGAAAGMAAYNVVTALATTETTALAGAMQLTGIVPIIELIVLALAALVAGVIYAYNHWDWFRVGVLAVWDAIKVAALFVWENALKPAFDGIWIAIQAVGNTAIWLWENAIGPAFEFIWLAARVLFAIVVTVVLAALIVAFRLVAAVVMWLWREVFQPSLEGIAALAGWLWRNILSPYLDGLMIAFRAVGTTVGWLWKEAIKPAFDGIAWLATWLWDNALKPAFDAIVKALKPVGDAFSAAKDFIAEQWGRLMDITKKPVNFVIQSVYTDGIKAVWDKVADFVKLPHLPDAPKLLASGGTVGPGWGPAVPMVTNRPTAIVGEGNPNYPEFVIPTDPKYRDRALALHSAAGTKLMADGGILGSVWGKVKNVAGDVWDFAKDGADLLMNPGKIWEKLTEPVRKVFAEIGDSPIAKTVIGIPTKVITSLKDKVVDFVTGGGNSASGGSPAGVQQWAPVVLQALSMLGQPATWLDTVLRRMNQESGGNPTVVNRWDSNWAAGTPSVGLMQVIGPTFRAYADQFRDVGPFEYGTSTNPLANVYAGLNYALHRYGSLAALNRPGGYDSGGWLPTGTSLVYNHTGKPEPVFTSGQWEAIRAGGLQGGGDVTVNARVYVGDREITDIVRVEVDRAETATATALLMGRRS